MRLRQEEGERRGGGGKKKKVMERERQEGESGEWSKRGNERKDRNDVEEGGRGGG